MYDGISLSLEAIKGWGGWSLFFLVIIWWIRGAPDRRRAATEGAVERKRVEVEAEAALQRSYGEYVDRLARRIDKMEREHEADRNSWLSERASLRAEHEADRRRHDEEREQWRKERQQLLDHVDGLERKLQSYSSSTLHLQDGPLNAPTTIARLVPDPAAKRTKGPSR
jgi:chromosome segregation ATPase